MEPQYLEHYRHEKTGGIYQVIAVARVEATIDRVVVYRGCDSVNWSPLPSWEHTWTRPISEFCDGRFIKADYLADLV
jgi:hypothetical protein